MTDTDRCRSLVAQARQIDWSAVVDALAAVAGDADGEEADRLIEVGRDVLRLQQALDTSRPTSRLSGRQIARARLGLRPGDDQ